MLATGSEWPLALVHEARVIANAVAASATLPTRRFKPSRCAIDAPFSCPYVSRWSLNFPGSRRLGYAEQGANLRVGTAESRRVNRVGPMRTRQLRRRRPTRSAGTECEGHRFDGEQWSDVGRDRLACLDHCLDPAQRGSGA